MKLTDERIDQIVSAFSDAKIIITPDLAHDLAQASENYNAAKIIELFNSRYEKTSDRLSPEYIADAIWRIARTHRELRAGNAFPITPIAHKLSALEGYNGEELASGLKYLADTKCWIKDGNPIKITEEGFKNL